MGAADIRREYSRGSLRRADLEANPVAQFQRWFAQAAGESSGGRWRKIGIALFKLWHAILGHTPIDVNAMALATVDKAGRPSTRTVLLKGVDERGFVFYTNHDSRKSRELAENPNAALTFYWADLERQVCVGGTRQQNFPRRNGGVFQKPAAGQPACCLGIQSIRRGRRPRCAGKEMERNGGAISRRRAVAAELGRFRFETGLD